MEAYEQHKYRISDYSSDEEGSTDFDDYYGNDDVSIYICRILFDVLWLWWGGNWPPV